MKRPTKTKAVKRAQSTPPSEKIYTVLFAEDVPHYASCEIRAVNETEAIAKARQTDLDDLFYEAAWENAVCQRIVHVIDDAGKEIAIDIQLADTFISYGGEAAQRLNDAAADLLDAAELAKRELYEFYSDDTKSEALRVLSLAIAKAKGGAA